MKKINKMSKYLLAAFMIFSMVLPTLPAYASEYIDHESDYLLSESEDDVSYNSVGSRSLTSNVTSWSQFRSAVNNTNVSTINVTRSFTSANTALNRVDRSLTINFIGDSTITVNHNQPLTIGTGRTLTITAQGNSPIILTRNTLSQPFIQGELGSIINFNGTNGRILIGDSSTESHVRPFLRTDGTVNVIYSANLTLNEGIEARNIYVAGGSRLNVTANTITPITIKDNGIFEVQNDAALEVLHNGQQPVIKLDYNSTLALKNPRFVNISLGQAGPFSPLIQSSGLVTIEAINNSFWNLGSQSAVNPNLVFSSLNVQLSGANGMGSITGVGENFNDFENYFVGFSAYGRFTAGTDAPVFGVSLPGTEDGNNGGDGGD